MLTQSISHGCSVKALYGEPRDTDSSPKQEYTILQRVATFDHSATLCTIRRSCACYDCVWESHVRVATPTIVYQQETLQVHECAALASTGTFVDPLSRATHQLNTNLEVNNFATTVLGTLSYEGGHSHLEGIQTSLHGKKMDSLLVTENLEITVQVVIVCQEFNSGDLVVMENGVSIPAVFRQDQGVSADFGTLVLRCHRAPCQWKRVRDFATT